MLLHTKKHDLSCVKANVSLFHSKETNVELTAKVQK